MEGRRCMELGLTHQTKTQINVSCDGQSQPSHSFDLQKLVLKNDKELIDNPVSYGKKLYEALFPPDTQAQLALTALLDTAPGYLLLVTTDDDLDALPWEYTYSTDGFLVQ